MRKQIIIVAAVVILVSFNAFAYDKDVAHPRLTEKAIIRSGFNDYITDNLGLPDGIQSGVKNKKILEWLQYGSIKEDDPHCRASNHFLDPIDLWKDAHMSDHPWFIDAWCSGGDYPPENISSNITWATGYIAPDQKSGTGNQWDWDQAREYFFIYLTGIDFTGYTVAVTQSERDTYFSNSLRALGHEENAVVAKVVDFGSYYTHCIQFSTRWLWLREQYLYNTTRWYG